jgi:hypothetical protein
MYAFLDATRAIDGVEYSKLFGLLLSTNAYRFHVISLDSYLICAHGNRFEFYGMEFFGILFDLQMA